MTGPELVEHPSGAPGDGDAPVMALRGAGVDVDGRRVARILLGACLVALAVFVVVLFRSGAEHNAQVSELRHQGVVAEVTVTGCSGLMGGSGSNLAGYTCSGTLALDGHRYTVQLPGTAYHAAGTSVRVVAVPGDPSLVGTVGGVASSTTSTRVFLLPTILLVVLVATLAALWLRRRHVRAADASPTTGP